MYVNLQHLQCVGFLVITLRQKVKRMESANVEPEYWPRQNGDVGTGFTDYGGIEDSG